MRHQTQNVAECAAGVSDLAYAQHESWQSDNRTRHGPQPTHYHSEACDTTSPHSSRIRTFRHHSLKAHCLVIARLPSAPRHSLGTLNSPYRGCATAYKQSPGISVVCYATVSASTPHLRRCVIL